MKTITKKTKEKVERCLREKEYAFSVVWVKKSCTIFNVEGKAIEDFMLGVDEDEICYTSVSDASITLRVE